MNDAARKCELMSISRRAEGAIARRIREDIERFHRRASEALALQEEELWRDLTRPLMLENLSEPRRPSTASRMEPAPGALADERLSTCPLCRRVQATHDMDCPLLTADRATAAHVRALLVDPALD
jgi:hypothetical protein